MSAEAERDFRRYGGLLGKIAFVVDMKHQGHADEEIERLWEEHSAVKETPIEYGSEEYILLRLAQQHGVSLTEAGYALDCFLAASADGQTLH